MSIKRLGLLGRKIGMTRFFNQDGDSIPVTVVEVSDNRISQIKKIKKDGYSSVQVSYGKTKLSKMNRPTRIHISKAGIESSKVLKEFRIDSKDESKYRLGQMLKLEDLFSKSGKVDVRGKSIGKGFAGTIKRHNFRSQRSSHGNSRSHRAPGSISMAQDPGRVFPGKKMAGHMGDRSIAVQNLSILKLDISRQLMFLVGSIPGCKEGLVIVSPAIKTRGNHDTNTGI